MTYKQSLTMDKAWEHTGVPAIPFAGFFAKLKSAVKFNIPVGYQDESGFHLGVQPDRQQVQWPATW